MLSLGLLMLATPRAPELILWIGAGLFTIALVLVVWIRRGTVGPSVDAWTPRTD